MASISPEINNTVSTLIYSRVQTLRRLIVYRSDNYTTIIIRLSHRPDAITKLI